MPYKFNPFTGNLDLLNKNQDLSGYLTKIVADETYEPLLPATPTNPESKYLNGNKEWSPISFVGGITTAPIYFTIVDSDVSGYKKISYTVDTSETILTSTITSSEGTKLLRTYLYDSGIQTTEINPGNWSFKYTVKVSNAVGITRMKAEVFLRHTDNSETTLFSQYTNEINNTTYEDVIIESSQPRFVTLATDRVGVRVYVETTAGATITVDSVIGDGRSAYFIVPVMPRHSQLRDLNGDNNYLHVTSTEKSNYVQKTETHTIVIDGDLKSVYAVSPVKKIPYFDRGNGITITSIVVQSSVADPTTELNANIMYCDEQGTGAFPGANPTLVKAIDTTTGNFSWTGTTTVATSKQLYLLMDSDPTDANTNWTITINYTNA